MSLPDMPVENFTEYRSGFCKLTKKDDEFIPDVKPMDTGLYKYYQGANNFSYNSQHRNKAF